MIRYFVFILCVWITWIAISGEFWISTLWVYTIFIIIPAAIIWIFLCITYFSEKIKNIRNNRKF